MTQEERYAELRKNRATWWDQPRGTIKVSERVLALKWILIPDNHPDPREPKQKAKGGGSE